MSNLRSNFTPPFTMGDVVEYINSDKEWPKIHIIKECCLLSPNEYVYSTNHGAWIDHQDFILKEKSNLKSLTKLYNQY